MLLGLKPSKADNYVALGVVGDQKLDIFTMESADLEHEWENAMCDGCFSDESSIQCFNLEWVLQWLVLNFRVSTRDW